MPRATVHARRDLPMLLMALAEVGLSVQPLEAQRALKERHRAIDRNDENHDADLHFMRGAEEEDAPQAIAKALGYARERAWRAVGAVHAWLRDLAAEGAAAAGLRALADACHVVRDSYSRGHAVRAPAPGGPVVVGMKSWAADKRAGNAFGLVHILRHDLRFEFPFSRRAPEVPASDAAVGALLRLVVRVAALPREAQQTAFEEGWAAFVAAHFLPPGEEAPGNAAS